MSNEPVTVLSFKRYIHIVLSRHDEMSDWSVQIDGHVHEHISTEVIEALVECKLIDSFTLLESQRFNCQDEFVN
jgi:hypothetical protein